MTQEDWNARLTRMVATEVRRYRKELGMSAQQLADRCAKFGMPIPRSVLANLENGRRDTVSAAEVLVLARALDVPPVLLLVPVGRQELAEILPGEHMATVDAMFWLTGETEPGRESPPDNAAALARYHERLVHDWQVSDRNLLAAVERAERSRHEGERQLAGEMAHQYQQVATAQAGAIRRTRDQMREHDLIPPHLPAELESVLRED